MKLARDERWKRGRDERWEGGTKMGARERDGRGRVGGGGPPISISLSSPSPLLITCMLRLDTLLHRDLSCSSSS